MKHKVALLNLLRQNSSKLITYLRGREILDEFKWNAVECNNYDFGQFVFETLEDLLSKRMIVSIEYEWTILPQPITKVSVMFKDKFIEIESNS